MENKIADFTVGDLVKLCKKYDLDLDKTPIMYCEPEGDILTVITFAEVNKDIIELKSY